MLNREEIERMINQKIEPLTEEIAALKAQLSKVDLNHPRELKTRL